MSMPLKMRKRSTCLVVTRVMGIVTVMVTTRKRTEEDGVGSLGEDEVYIDPELSI